jgi:protein-tyrosine phosphatase
VSAHAWSEIVPGLWQGGDAVSPVGRFDHVVSLCAWGQQRTPGPADQTEWFIADGPVPEPEQRIWDLAEEVGERLDDGEQVLVRCQMGINRSGLIVASTLLLQGWTADEAIDRIRARRDPLALSNSHFVAWLRRQDPRGPRG